MPFHLIGLNHKTAPLGIRESLAFNESECAAVLPLLTDGETAGEALLISTCNRVEVLIESESGESFSRVVEVLARTKNLAADDFYNHFYQFSGAEAVRHLFRVTASLDSMIVGEAQISGQVRRAYAVAVEAKTVSRNLHKLLHHAFAAAKRVRTETRIAHNAANAATAAVEKAKKIFGTLSDKTVLLVGAGEMAEIAAKNLIANGANRILICNRTAKNALDLVVEFGGEIVDFANLDDTLSAADIVICSTTAPDYLINFAAAQKAQIIRQNRPQLYVDISVPRNIAPEIGELANVFLADIDDLHSVVSINLAERRREAKRAETIIDEEVENFVQSLRWLDKGEMLGALRQKMQRTATAEFVRQRGKLGELTAEQETAIENLLLSTVNKIAHPILYGLRRSHDEGAGDFLEILSTMLGGADESNHK